MSSIVRTSSGKSRAEGSLKKVKDKKEQRVQMAAKLEAERLGEVKDKQEEDLITIIQSKGGVEELGEEETQDDSDDETMDLF